ncbi:MAG: hypothetical protein ABIQ57_08995 [Candidatus Kapaibacterium sp.]
MSDRECWSGIPFLRRGDDAKPHDGARIFLKRHSIHGFMIARMDLGNTKMAADNSPRPSHFRMFSRCCCMRAEARLQIRPDFPLLRPFECHLPESNPPPMNEQLKNKIAISTDIQILNMLSNEKGYTPEAVALAKDEVDYRGGRDALIEKVRAAAERNHQLAGCRAEIASDLKDGESTDAIVARLAGQGISGDDVHQLVREMHEARLLHLHETTDTASSLVRTLIGGFIASVLGGVYLSFLIFGTRRVMVILAFGFVALCYGIVRIASGGKNTTIVFLVTFGAIVLSVPIGLWLHSIGFLSGR